jgi:esterase/lipase
MIIIVFIIVVLIILFLAGPRPKLDLQLKTFDLPEDLDRYLAESEARYSGIIPGAEKTIIWANPAKTRTALSIVYLHGYSATRQESAPLGEQLAARLGANLFYTRFTGHGCTGDALAQARINDLLNDTVEAVEIGKRLGDKVIVIGTSTGGTLATWLAMQPNHDEVEAYVLMSPCYRLRDSMAVILTWPWGSQLASLVAGPEYSWTPQNPRQAQYWTTRYPSRALNVPVNLFKLVRESKLETIQKPVLVLYSPHDEMVDSQMVERAYARFGSAVKGIVPVTDSENPESHVLAGDILAPGDTKRMADIIFEFVASLR